MKNLVFFLNIVQLTLFLQQFLVSGSSRPLFSKFLLFTVLNIILTQR